MLNQFLCSHCKNCSELRNETTVMCLAKTYAARRKKPKDICKDFRDKNLKKAV